MWCGQWPLLLWCAHPYSFGPKDASDQCHPGTVPTEWRMLGQSRALPWNFTNGGSNLSLHPKREEEERKKETHSFPKDGLLGQRKTEEVPMHANHVQQQNEVTMERGRAKWQIAGLKVWIPGHLKPDASILSYLVTWDYSSPFIQLQPRTLIKTSRGEC